MERSEKEEYIFSLDIGTRSIIGMVGVLKDEKLEILSVEKQEHSSRAMVDGQIEDISRVAKVAENVKKKLEETIKTPLENVHVAAAGRALKTGKASYELELQESQTITDELIKKLETGAIAEAEKEFEREEEADDRQFYLVGYSVCQYYLDEYPISNLLDHKGKHLKADVIATFLPGEVVESLYAAMKKAGLEVASMTLEPIASMNAAIPQKLRLLNLVLVDIGAGTSDIAAARDGSIAGYTMATIAGDEITECLMKEFLIDFETAEKLKMEMGSKEELTYLDVLGFEHSVSPQKVKETADVPVQTLCKQISEKILEVNGNAPSAVFLTGGGSKLDGIREYVAQYLDMDLNRVALGGNNFSVYAESKEYDLKDPEYSTPLGIAVSAAFNLISDSFYIKLNGHRAKLFRSGKLTIRDVLMMNGYGYRHLISHSGQNLVINIDGQRTVLYGGYAAPAQLTLNGKDAVVSDLVKAGDEITFRPAVNGEDAKAKLKDVAKLERRGNAMWEGQEVPLGVTAFVNGQSEEPEKILLTGDSVQTCRMETAGDFAEYYEVEGDVLVNGVKVSSDWKIEPGDQLRIREKEWNEKKHEETAAANSEEAAEIKTEANVETEIERKTETKTGTKTEDTAETAGKTEKQPEAVQTDRTAKPRTGERPAIPQNIFYKDRKRPDDVKRETSYSDKKTEPETEERPLWSDRRNLRFRLNGKELILPEKDGRTPYYLMDMLAHTDLDVSKPKGDIHLQINGIDAGFQSVVRSGDSISIGWADEF